VPEQEEAELGPYRCLKANMAAWDAEGDESFLLRSYRTEKNGRFTKCKHSQGPSFLLDYAERDYISSFDGKELYLWGEGSKK